MTTFPAIKFHQYGHDSDDDELVIFAAPAKLLAQWAGVPSKSWRIRMLFQRWMTERRENDLRDFWETASLSGSSGHGVILGPNAITVGIQGPAVIRDGQIDIGYSDPVSLADPLPPQLASLAEQVLPGIIDRLGAEQKSIANDFKAAPFADLPEIGYDYVLEFALQLIQMSKDPEWFISTNEIQPTALGELLTALETLCRPALVIDGQHRLKGAALAKNDIMLPVVAIPNCGWVEQVYQFIVINEKAQKVDSSILTDIFGSSLTNHEQGHLRDRFARARVDVEARVAAVIANREEESPFFGLVQLKLQQAPPSGTQGFISERTIRLLIEGGSRGAKGWRRDEDFYEVYVKPTFPDRLQWEGWTSGLWRKYWFAFWREIRNFYNEQAIQAKQEPLWSTAVTNLTKGVTLRLFQRLFMAKAVARVRLVHSARQLLEEELGPEAADARIQKRLKEAAIPHSVEEFSASVRSWFLEKGVPVRVFLRDWVKSLDDDEGQNVLYEELDRAYTAVSQGNRYVARNPNLFTSNDE